MNTETLVESLVNHPHLMPELGRMMYKEHSKRCTAVLAGKTCSRKWAMAKWFASWFGAAVARGNK